MRPAISLILVVVLVRVSDALSRAPPRIDPEANYDVIQLITSKGYPAEQHYATTPDGYILGLQRIPYGRGQTPGPRPVVFLQHGLLCSAADWVVNLANESFGFILADAGFDVWLGNVRGNTYSLNHTKLTPKDKEFWLFSFDEHALIDLPTMLNHALSVSGQSQLFYAGHSQGTVMGFAGFTANKTLASQINAFIALAPVTTVKHVEGALAVIAPFYKWFLPALDAIGDGEFLPNSQLLDDLAKYVCPDQVIDDICENVIFLICGFNKDNINITRLDVYYSHTPAGTSVQNLVHFSQEVLDGYFCKYDYGSAEANIAHYGTPTPPSYNVTELTVPTMLFTGGNDWLADPTDVAELIPKIKSVTIYDKNIPQYEHLDFLWGLDAATDVYEEAIAIMKQRL
ncbi:hypothetical protein EMCRGX_G025434 [Ephydatia muelleri]